MDSGDYMSGSLISALDLHHFIHLSHCIFKFLMLDLTDELLLLHLVGMQDRENLFKLKAEKQVGLRYVVGMGKPVGMGLQVLQVQVWCPETLTCVYTIPKTTGMQVLMVSYYKWSLSDHSFIFPPTPLPCCAQPQSPTQSSMFSTLSAIPVSSILPLTVSPYPQKLIQLLGVTVLLELCARNRNPEGVTEDPKDRVISISGGRSFAFSFADALELHWT